MSINNRKMSAAARAVKHALSERRAEFGTRISEIEGEANARGGGVASLSSGTFVRQFVDAIETELRSRTQVARKALGNAVDSQKLNLRPEIVEQVKKAIRKVWSEETEDLREWYQKRVKSANKEIAEEHPFERSEQVAFQRIFVGLENKALAPGIMAKIKDKILDLLIERIAQVIVGIIILTLLLIYREYVSSLLSRLFPGNG